MSDHPCSCGFCPLYSIGPHPIGPDDIYYCGKERISKYQRQCTSHKGCLSHPKAREYLNKEVIEELESESKSLMSDAKKRRDICSLMKSEGIDITIKLLKEGVKK